MARNKYVLCCALRHVFLNDFGLDRVFIMNDLAALFLYYADSEVPAELSREFNKLNVWLTKVELLRKPRKEEPYPMPKDFNVTVDSSDCSELRNCTVAPELNMPAVPQYGVSGALLDSLGDELSEINVAGIAAYVREKAVKAGDLILDDIEGDTHW